MVQFSRDKLTHFSIRFARQLGAGKSARVVGSACAVALVLMVSVTAGAQQGGNTPPAVSLPEIPLSRLPMPPEIARPTVAPPPASPGLKTGKQVGGKYDVSRIGERGIGGGLNFYSLEREQMLGRELAQEVERDARLVRDPVITEYVNRVGQNIVRNSDARVPFTIKVIDNDEINAFALPGGFFYVNTGLIMAAENEAELAGVMAHEIAHVAARHATKNATKAEIFNLASIPMIFVGGPVGYAVRQAAGLAVPMTFLKFSRNAEREADLLGMEYQYASGYDPQEFIRFFEKLKLHQKKKGNFISKAFATHPMTDDRVKKAQESLAKYLPPREEYVVSTSEFDEVKARMVEITNRHRLDGGKVTKPTLRKRTAESAPDAGEKSEDERPTLRRRPD